MLIVNFLIMGKGSVVSALPDRRKRQKDIHQIKIRLITPFKGDTPEMPKSRRAETLIGS